VCKSKWVRGGCVLAAFFMAETSFLGAESAGQIHLFPPAFDKVAHFVYFGLMAVLLAHGVGARLQISDRRNGPKPMTDRRTEARDVRLGGSGST